jgi:cell wall-associated NlpC family hydrolase
MRAFAILYAAWLGVMPTPRAFAHDGVNPQSAMQALTTESTQYLSRARELVIQALGLLGVTYRYGGDSPDTGFDCSGLVRHVFGEAAGLTLPHNARGMSRVGGKIARDELQPGDLVFFNTLRQPYSHVGIYVGEQRFIHAPSRGGEVEIVNMADPYWQNRYNGARRVDLR